MVRSKKLIYNFILLLICFLSVSCTKNNENEDSLKSPVRTINDSIVDIKIDDSYEMNKNIMFTLLYSHVLEKHSEMIGEYLYDKRNNYSTVMKIKIINDVVCKYAYDYDGYLSYGKICDKLAVEKPLYEIKQIFKDEYQADNDNLEELRKSSLEFARKNINYVFQTQIEIPKKYIINNTGTIHLLAVCYSSNQNNFIFEETIENEKHAYRIFILSYNYEVNDGNITFKLTDSKVRLH